MSEYSAIVLAAGEGTRLRPLTQNRPKPMLPAATKPILEHVFDQLIDAGISKFVVVVGYRCDRVQSYFGSTYRNVPITYVTQKKQLGTGHAVLAAESEVDDTCLVINGDQIVDSRIVADTIARHDSAAAATIALLQRPNVEPYGGVRIGEDDVATEIVENPRDGYGYYLNAGVYMLEPAAFDAVRSAEPSFGEHHLFEGLSKLIDSGETVRGTVSEGLWVDATYPWDLLDVSFELFDRGVVTSSPVISGRETTVHDEAIIRDPIILDQDCAIGPDAVVGPYVCLGENTTVGANAVLERSVVDDDTTIGANATVVDCVTGTGVEIGPGSTIPGGPGDVRVGDTVYEDEALGAVLADRVTDRGGVTYVPGALVGPETEIQSGATIRGTLAGGTEVRS
ncbi:sugar phosphate nucleotidyltransferase [Natronococcus occultus]|uniref:Bifunctional protein GlmU n=1 Tax=Natronococcus occultus SP4 TaxID=694430 RepID=L0K1Y1_9EURY|nr:sugar phosphate nucleotidyltransferase [Natronococcus occultus]AGB39292.1 Nucleoside-diphosphate-sugar pyrophosphorylase family protein [Natronococcus occultus SP4]